MASVQITSVMCDVCGTQIEDADLPESSWDLAAQKQVLRCVDVCINCRGVLASIYDKADPNRLTGRRLGRPPSEQKSTRPVQRPDARVEPELVAPNVVSPELVVGYVEPGDDD